MVLVSELSQKVRLLSASKKRNVRDDQIIGTVQQFDRASHAFGRHGALELLGMLLLSLENIGERLANRRPAGLEEIAPKNPLRIDQRSEFRRILKQLVQSRHALLEWTGRQRGLDAEEVSAAHHAEGRFASVCEHHPFGLRGVGRQAATGNFDSTKADGAADQAPSGECDVEHSNLRTASVDLEAVQVLVQDVPDGSLQGKVLLFHAEACQKLQALDQEVAAAAAGIENPQLRRRPWPTLEAARRWAPRSVLVANEPQMREVVASAGLDPHRLPEVLFGLVLATALAPGQDPCRPPRADRVVEQEEHHVPLGEQLRDGGQLVGADL